jgi:hypothetical protein
VGQRKKGFEPGISKWDTPVIQAQHGVGREKEMDCSVDFLFSRAFLGAERNGPMAKDDVKKEGWSAEELGEESSYEGTTEISRRMRRGDETAGDPNARDVAGAIPEEDTPYGREVRDTPQGSAGEKPDEEKSGEEVP